MTARKTAVAAKKATVVAAVPVQEEGKTFLNVRFEVDSEENFISENGGEGDIEEAARNFCHYVDLQGLDIVSAFLEVAPRTGKNVKIV